MGLYKRKDSDIWWMSFSTMNRQYKKSTGTEDRKLAERIHDSVKGRIALGTWIPEAEAKQRFTFSELTEKYSAWAEGRHKSWSGSRHYMIGQLDKYFGQYDLNQIDVQMIEQFQTDQIKRGLNAGGVNRLVSSLKAMFTKALDWKMTDEAVIITVRRVKALKGEVKRLRYLSVQECQELFNSCDAYLKPIVQFALNSGCRRGEILNLKWDNVDLKHGFISLIETKNGERRETPINDTLRSVLQGITRRLDVPYVFFDSETGGPASIRFEKRFKTAVKKAGIKDFHFHDLRHTFASHLVMAGVDITTVSKLLGHKSLTMTLRYSHLAPAHLQAGIKKLDNIFNPKKAGFASENEANYTVFRTVELDSKKAAV